MMSVSSVSSLSQYLSSLTAQSGSGSDSTSIAKELESLASGNSSTTSSALQELVSLGNGNSSSGTSSLYNAKGLLQAVNRNMALNDPLLNDSSSDSSTSLFDTLSSDNSNSSLSLSSIVSALTNSDNTSNTSTSTSGSSDSSDINTRIAEELKKNPALANTLIQNETITNMFKNL
jgi:hypothetical protein